MTYPELQFYGDRTFGNTTLVDKVLKNKTKAGTYQYTVAGNIYKVTLPEMRKAANSSDIWNRVTYEFTKTVGAVVYSGTEQIAGVNWRPYAGTYACYFPYAPTPLKPASSGEYADILCSHLSTVTYSHVYYGYTGLATYRSTAYGLYFRVPSTIASSDATFKAWLTAQAAAGTPVTVHYRLNTPVVSSIFPEPIWLAPVFDRTQADCDNKTVKGSLNVSDINRIELNLRYIKDKFYELYYAPRFYNNSEYPWSRIEYFKKHHYNSIKQSIINMQQAFAKYPDIPELSLSGDNVPVTYEELNLIEYSLYDMKWLLDEMLACAPYANDCYACDFHT